MQYWKVKAVKVTPSMILLSSLIITGCQDKTSDDALLARQSTKACETKYTDYCDSDGDGISDSKERESGWDSNDPHVPVENGNRDYDGDGIKNGRESVANWDMNDPNDPVNNGNFDSDGDGVKDGREAIEGWDSNDPNSPVIDGDADEDRDGINKGLEEIEGWSDTNPDDPVKNGDSDSDGDGIKNGKETIEGWNPDDPNDPVNKGDSDSDGDGIKDGKETIEGWDPSDPNDPVANGASDDDGDGLENGREVVEGWDPNAPNDPVVDGNIDSDGDGIPNGKETIEGWDPNDPSDPYDGFCSMPQEDGKPDCGGEDNDGDGQGDNGSSNLNGYCEAGEHHTPDCDGLYVSPAEDGSIDGNKGSALTDLAVTPEALGLEQDLKGQLSATATFANDMQKNVSGLVVWLSDNESVASVYNPADSGYDGHKSTVDVTANSSGETDISATGSSKSSSARITVTEPGAVLTNTVLLKLENTHVAVGLTNQAFVEYKVEGSDQTRTTLDIADTDAITWSVSPVTEGLSIDAEGKITVGKNDKTIALIGSNSITATATYKSTGIFNGVTSQSETFSLTLGTVSDTNVALSKDGTTLSTTDSIYKGDNLKAAAVLTDGNGDEYITSDPDLVEWNISPASSGVTIDSDRNIDTSNADTSQGPIKVTITWTGKGGLDGQNGSYEMTINDAFSNFSNAACGSQLNDTDQENAKGSCLKIATAEVDGKALWYTSSPSVALVQELGFVTSKGDINTNNGLTYVDGYNESGSQGPNGGVFARFDQLSYDGVGIENSQYARWCKHLASINYAGRDNWRPTNAHELGLNTNDSTDLGVTQGQGLRNIKGNMWQNYGWPTDRHYWSTTFKSGDRYYNLDLGDSQFRFDQPTSEADYVSCVSE